MLDNLILLLMFQNKTYKIMAKIENSIKNNQKL